MKQKGGECEVFEKFIGRVIYNSVFYRKGEGKRRRRHMISLLFRVFFKISSTLFIYRTSILRFY